MRKLIEFLKEVQIEFKHVRWPTKDELIGLTTAVILFSIILSAIVFGFDQLFSYMIRFIP
ncbi:MAG: preprotein translocase subunit SecE [Candidatus Zixiibacteriota bacterium]